MAVIVKATPEAITHHKVDDEIGFDGFVEIVTFQNFGKDIIIDDLIDVFIPETNTRYALILT